MQNATLQCYRRSLLHTVLSTMNGNYKGVAFSVASALICFLSSLELGIISALKYKLEDHARLDKGSCLKNDYSSPESTS